MATLDNTRPKPVAIRTVSVGGKRFMQVYRKEGGVLTKELILLSPDEKLLVSTPGEDE